MHSSYTNGRTPCSRGWRLRPPAAAPSTAERGPHGAPRLRRQGWKHSRRCGSGGHRARDALGIETRGAWEVKGLRSRQEPRHGKGPPLAGGCAAPSVGRPEPMARGPESPGTRRTGRKCAISRLSFRPGARVERGCGLVAAPDTVGVPAWKVRIPGPRRKPVPPTPRQPPRCGMGTTLTAGEARWDLWEM